MVVLDTTVVSALMRSESDAVVRLAQESPGSVVLTTPVFAEIKYGLERLSPGRRRDLLQSEWARLRGVLAWHDWTAPAAEVFGREKARLRRNGIKIDDLDVAIGSIAIMLSARLATRNVKHFERLVGLQVEAW